MDSSNPGTLRRLWIFLSSPSAKYSILALTSVSFVVGILFWGGFHTGLEMTNSLEDKALDLLLMKRSSSAGQFLAFVDGYKRLGKDAPWVLRRLKEIEKRGRYQTRTLLAEDDTAD